MPCGAERARARDERREPRREGERALLRAERPQRGRQRVRRRERREVLVDLREERRVLRRAERLRCDALLQRGEPERERGDEPARDCDGDRQRAGLPLNTRETEGTHRSGSGFSLLALSHLASSAPGAGRAYISLACPAGSSL